METKTRKKRSTEPKREYDLARLSTRETAEIFGVTPASVENWLKKGCPHELDPRGKPYFASHVVFGWRLDQERGKKRPLGDGSEQEELFSDELERLRKYKADMEQIKLGIARGELVKVEDVRRALMKAADVIKRRLEVIGKKLAVQMAKELSPEGCEKVMTAEMISALKELSQEKIIGDVQKVEVPVPAAASVDDEELPA